MKHLLLLAGLVASCSFANAQHLWGDVNHDGKISVQDMTILADIILENRDAEEISIKGGVLEETWNADAPLYHNGHEYVDLGIKDSNGNVVYWATTNWGANQEYEYGRLQDTWSNAFSWGGHWIVPTDDMFKQIKTNCNIELIGEYESNGFGGVPGLIISNKCDNN